MGTEADEGTRGSEQLTGQRRQEGLKGKLRQNPEINLVDSQRICDVYYTLWHARKGAAETGSNFGRLLREEGDLLETLALAQLKKDAVNAVGSRACQK